MPLPTQNAVINPAADRRLFRIAMGYGVVVFVLLFGTQFLLAWANVKYGGPTLRSMAASPKLIALNLGSVLVVLIPFYAGIHRLYAARLEIGRERVAARAWSEAAAALEPFTSPFQRFLDTDGEAHFLLAQAYLGLGDKAKAERVRAFVRRKKSVWAEKLAPAKGRNAKNQGAKGRGAAVYQSTDGADAKRPRPPKAGPRKRF